jgi:hypothetical protein
MSTSILSPFDMGDRTAPKGSEPWCRWLHFEILRLIEDKEQLGDRLQVHVSAFEDTTAYQKLRDQNGRPFIDFADYCQTPPPYGLGRLPAVVHEEAEIRAAGPHGGDRRSEEFKNQGYIVTLKDRGNASKYTVARLERDRPDLAARVEAGEMSAHAAAIEAGFRPKTCTVPLTVEGATRLMLKLSDAERDEVMARVLKAAS